MWATPPEWCGHWRHMIWEVEWTLFGLGSQMNFAEPALVAGAVAVSAVALASGPEKQRNLLAAGSGAEVISGVILSAPAECSLTLVGAAYDTEWG